MKKYVNKTKKAFSLIPRYVFYQDFTRLSMLQCWVQDKAQEISNSLMLTSTTSTQRTLRRSAMHMSLLSNATLTLLSLANTAAAQLG